jgi:2-iminobutanoate/2-iminopropanoate deaminase
MEVLSQQLEKTMIHDAASLRLTLGFAALGFSLAALAPAQAQAPNTTPNAHMEIIHHPNYDKTVNMPFPPAIKIKSGKLLWLAGTTALPVYHDHPHKREQILQYLTNDLEAQTKRTMDGIMETLKAAGASPKDVVHVFIFRTRPRMGDIGVSSRVVNSYFAPFNHKPTTTNMAVLELGEPEQLIEIQVVAVVD